MCACVIMLHLGNQSYLKDTLEQAKRFKNRVILIGDKSNEDICECLHVEHYDLDTVKKRLIANPHSVYDKFLRNYKHFSLNNEPFEKFCIERWFIIHELMDILQIHLAFICDSDVMIYFNTDELLDLLPITPRLLREGGKELYISSTCEKNKVTAGQSVWSIEKLNEFIQYIHGIYTNDVTVKSLETEWSSMSETDKMKGGFSDMTLLYHFLEQKNTTLDEGRWARHTTATREPCKNTIGITVPPARGGTRETWDLSLIRNGCVFDNSIDLSGDAYDDDIYEMEYYNFCVKNMKNNIKKIRWDSSGSPYCINKTTQDKIRLMSIHCHGSKHLTKFLSKPKSISAIFFSLNDNYTPDNKERTVICLNHLLQNVDEVVYVDWGSPDGVSLLEILKDKYVSKTGKIKHVKVSKNDIVSLLPKGVHFIQQAMARNIALRHASCEYIISTNVDVIVPPRHELMNLLDPNAFVTIARKDVDVNFCISLFNNANDKMHNVLVNYCNLRQNSNDTDPINTFKSEAKLQLDEKSELYRQHITYSKVWNCGDFQIAHRDIWFDIRGFEEGKYESPMCDDSIVHKKACLFGYKLLVLNEPHVFHMSHPARSAHNKQSMGDIQKYFINLGIEKRYTYNIDTWGIFPNLTTQIEYY